MFIRLPLRLLRIKGSTEEIARGLAVGVFFGFTPLLGLHMVIALALASILKANKVAAAAATWIGNPLTWPIIFLTEFKIGQGILGANRVPPLSIPGSWQEVVASGVPFLVATALGSLFLGTAASLATYFVFLNSIYIERLRRGLTRLAR